MQGRKKKGILGFFRNVGKVPNRHFSEAPGSSSFPVDSKTAVPGPSNCGPAVAIPGPSTLDSVATVQGPSDCCPVVEQQNKRTKKGIRGFLWKTGKVLNHCFTDLGPSADREPNLGPSAVPSLSTLDSETAVQGTSRCGPVVEIQGNKRTKKAIQGFLWKIGKVLNHHYSDLGPSVGLGPLAALGTSRAFLATQNPQPSKGTLSSLYDIGKILGKGAFGFVYMATRKSDGQKVAVKFSIPNQNLEVMTLPGCSRPLLTEVVVHLWLQEAPRCPHIIQMLEWFVKPDNQYTLVMEYPYPCRTLNDFILLQGGILEESLSCDLYRQAVLAVKHCIDLGVSHNDVKSDNFLVNTETLQLKLIDFGLSSLIMSVKIKKLNIQSMVFDLGLVLLEMTTLATPLEIFSAGSCAKVPLSLSHACQNLIRQSINSDRAKRPTLEQILAHRWLKEGRRTKYILESGEFELSSCCYEMIAFQDSHLGLMPAPADLTLILFLVISLFLIYALFGPL